MNGHKVFDFALHIVPQTVKALLRKTGCSIQDIDIFIFHQANRYLLEAIGLSLGIPHERLQITLNDCGNTVSSTIPIALKHAELEGRIKRGDIAMVVGFGVGYSWAATLLKWNPISG
jgi:3-oxoacyl-[acyl-carrier-protein] synthase-3